MVGETDGRRAGVRWCRWVLLAAWAAACPGVGWGADGPATAAGTPTTFAHPGLYTSAAEVAALQRRVAAGDAADPVVQGWRSTMATRFADVAYEPHPVAVVRRGKDYASKTDPPAMEREAAMTAYTLALRWAIGGDTAARDKAIAIMDAWSGVFEDHAGDENTYLDCSWVTPPWCAAAELVRYAKVGGRTADWPADRVERFRTMVRKLNAQSSKIITRPFNSHSNWGTSSMLADEAAGVFLDDSAVYARGRDALLKAMPFVLLKGGWCNEVFRDSWHGTVALSAVIQAADVAAHQGDLSIYHARYDGQADPRLVVCLKWYGQALRGVPMPLPPMGGAKWKPQPWVYHGGHASRNTGSFEVALDFYTHVEPTPGLEGFGQMVLDTYRPSGQDNGIYIESDTLTSGGLHDPRFPRP